MLVDDVSADSTDDSDTAGEAAADGERARGSSCVLVGDTYARGCAVGVVTAGKYVKGVPGMRESGDSAPGDAGTCLKGTQDIPELFVRRGNAPEGKQRSGGAGGIF